MSYEDKSRYNQQHYERRENVIGEMLGEVPIVGEIFESLGQARIGKKGIKKLFCCCAPLALILLIPLIMLVYWLIKGSLSLFKINLSDINWIEQIKSWFIGNFQLDQISQWGGDLQGILGQ